MGKVGRPSSFKDEYCDQAEQLARLGATDKEMADFFGVSEQCLNNWKNSKPEFVESLKKGKIVSDTMVSEKLFRRACGYDYMEDVPIKLKDYNAEGKQIERVQIVTLRRIIPPDTTAQIFWLKNRRPTNWRDKPVEEADKQSNDSLVNVLKEALGNA